MIVILSSLRYSRVQSNGDYWEIQGTRANVFNPNLPDLTCTVIYPQVQEVFVSDIKKLIGYDAIQPYLTNAQKLTICMNALDKAESGVEDYMHSSKTYNNISSLILRNFAMLYINLMLIITKFSTLRSTYIKESKQRNNSSTNRYSEISWNNGLHSYCRVLLALTSPSQAKIFSLWLTIFI